MRRDETWRSPPPHLSQGMVSQQHLQQAQQQQQAGVPQFQQQPQQPPLGLPPHYQHQASQPGTVQFQQLQQHSGAQYLQLQQQPDGTQYHSHPFHYNQQQQRIIMQNEPPSYQQHQLQGGYFQPSVDPISMITGPHVVTPSPCTVNFQQHHISHQPPPPRGITRLHSPGPEQIRPLRHPSVIYHSPHPADQGPSTSFHPHHHPHPPPVRAQTWVPPDPQQLQQQERQQIQQQMLQFTQDLWAASIPPIMPSVTTPSPVPYQQPLSSNAPHFCPVHSLQPSPSQTPERRTPKPLPPTPPAPQLTPEEAEMEQERMDKFVEQFKEERIKYGYSAANVNQQLAIRYGTTFPSGKIKQFEENKLSLQEMMSTKQVLKSWILDMARAGGMIETDVQKLSDSLSPPRREIRKKRTVIDDQTKIALDREFRENSKPTPTQQAEIATRLGVDKDVIKIWFANQRQRVKKAQPPERDGAWTQNLGMPGLNFEPDIPSPDIESQIPLLDLGTEEDLDDLQ